MIDAKCGECGHRTFPAARESFVPICGGCIVIATLLGRLDW